jgi:Family of unknown function (DUF5898)
VLKFFRSQKDIDKDKIFAAAEAEAEMWRILYGDYGIDFVKAHGEPRVFLVMPYLIIPHNFEERQKFVEGDEQSMLYKALVHLTSKQQIHKEVRWHHFGKLEVKQQTVAEKKRSANGKKKSVDEDLAVFCDLAHMEQCDDQAKQKEWVVKTFNDMKKLASENNEAARFCIERQRFLAVDYHSR